MKKDLKLSSLYESKIEKMIRISTFLFLVILFVSLCLNTLVYSAYESNAILINSILLFLIILTVLVCQRILFVGKIHVQLGFVIFLFFLLPHLHFLASDKFFDFKYIFFVYYTCFIVFLFFLARLLNSYLMYITKLKREYEDLVNDDNCNMLSKLIFRSIFHDLSTPLSVVCGISKMLEDGVIEKKKEKEVLKKLSLAIDQMENIIESSDILVRNRNVEENFSAVCEIEKLNDLLFSRMNSCGIKFVVLGDRNIFLFGEKVMFLRVCMNILINSIEEFERITKARKKITVKVVRKDKKVIITFTDNGNGFDKDTDFGCGLRFCELVVKEKFYGYLEIDSEIGKHCRVTLFLPAS